MSNAYAEASRSVWMDIPSPDAPRLDRDIRADVLVVGAGIAGLSTAYELSLRGKSVVLVDRGPIGRGMTARTTAHLASDFDDYYHRLIELHGAQQAGIVWQSQAAAIDRIEAVQREEEIACDFRRLDGYLLAPDQESESLIDRERAACAEIGYTGVERLVQAPWQAAAGLRFPRQARFHPLKYIAGLAEAFTRRGGSLFAESCMTSVEEADGVVNAKCETGHKITAEAAVIATNSPIVDRLAVHAKQAPYRTYVIAAAVPKESVEDALYWDTEEPYHYVRLHPQDGHDLLIVGGEDHKTGRADDAEARFRRLEDWARLRFPAMQTVQFRWSGQVLEPVDAVGFIGRNPGNERIYVATGDSGQGMTHGALAGMLLADLILSGDSAWAAAYSPSRKRLRSTSQLVSENTTVIGAMSEHLTAGEVGSEDEIRPGSGAIVRSGLHKLAVSRDRSGVLHRRSATCTHAGCIVHWNSLEECWDCPCHGSHFAPDGTVMNGPAVTPLATLEAKRKAG